MQIPNIDFGAHLLKIIYSIIVLLAGRLIVFAMTRLTHGFDKFAEKQGWKKLDLTEHTISVFRTFSSSVVYIIVVVIILYIFGLKDAVATAIAGAGIAGLAIGFASKDVLSNVISGVFIIFDKPLKIGDRVRIGNYFGKVREISIRTTKIRTDDGAIVYIPNSKLATDVIANYSVYAKVRAEVSFQIPSAVNPQKLEKAIKEIKEKLREKEWVYHKKEPWVELNNITRGYITLSAMAWIRPTDFIDKKNKLYLFVLETLKKHKISF